MPMPNIQALYRWLGTGLSSGGKHIGTRDDLALFEWSRLPRQLFARGKHNPDPCGTLGGV